MSENKQTRKRRGDLFFPLLLIAIGIIFLLSNTGVIQGDAWSLVWQFWPVLLIVIGLDSIFKREGLVGATFMIGLGVLFLLANLGYINVSIWQLIFTLWPIFLIAIGFDILFGRRSLIASIFGMLLVAAILVGALWLFGVRVEGRAAVMGDQISQSIDGASSAMVSIEPGAGDFNIESSDQSGILVQGSVPTGNGSQVKSSYTVADGVGSYTLRGLKGQVFLPSTDQRKWMWVISLTEAIPLDLTLGLGAGDMDADLRSLDLNALKVSMGVGDTSVTLPESGRFSAEVNGGIGQLQILVPEGMALRVNGDTALVSVNVPSGYIKLGDVYKSPDYDSAEDRVDLVIGLAIGNVSVREVP